MGSIRETALKTILTRLKGLFAPMDTTVFSVNNETPTDGNVTIRNVATANNLTSDHTQDTAEEFILRTSGGSAAISDGEAEIVRIMGNIIRNGYVPEKLTADPIEAERTDAQAALTVELVRDTFVGKVNVSGDLLFVYDSGQWKLDNLGVTLTEYGLNVANPIEGDQILVKYTKEVLGTIVTATPTRFVATGWNLYNNTAGNKFAYVKKYSENYGFKISGSYSSVEFAPLTNTLSRTTITPSASGLFTVPADGYVFVTPTGDGSDIYIIATWSDWINGPNKEFELYKEDDVNLSSLLSLYFPFGMARVGSVSDEIDYNKNTVYSRIGRIGYTASNYADKIAIMRANNYEYVADSSYIYYVKPDTENPPSGIDTLHVYSGLELDGKYDASQYGEEFFVGTTVPVYLESIYGNNLKNKLERDVLTISQQTLNDDQKATVRNNIGAINSDAFKGLFKIQTFTCTYTIKASSSKSVTQETLGYSAPEGYTYVGMLDYFTGHSSVFVYSLNPEAATIFKLRNSTATDRSSITLSMTCLFARNETLEEVVAAEEEST